MDLRATWDADDRSLDQLIAAALAENRLSDEDYATASNAYAVLLWRSGIELLERAVGLTESAEWTERDLGVDLLGQIHDPRFREVEQREAWSTPALRNGYLDETLPVLRALTATEQHADVLASIAHAFGERADPRGIAPLAYLAEHEDSDVREAVARSLPMCSLHADVAEGADAVAAARASAEQIAAPLLVLAEDPDGDVRNWALFGLHLGELDTPEIREMFLAHVSDPYRDASMEALYGLANLGDARGVEPLRQMLAEVDDATILIQACELHGDARLVPVLQALRDDGSSGDHDELDAALDACRAGLGWQGTALGLWPTG